jgi:hypothetical protein
MTLILTVANAGGVHQSSDYQLTDLSTGVPVADSAGSKQLHATFERLHLELAFTGVASVGSGTSARRTIEWLSGELNELHRLQPGASVQEICDALQQRCAAEMKPYGTKGVLTVVLTFAVVGEPFRVAVISNVDWRRRPPQARNRFTVEIHTITKPLTLISGYRDAVPIYERHRLESLARGSNKRPEDIVDVLREINVVAAKNSGGYISEGCWVASQVSDGSARRRSGLNMGPHEGGIPQLLGGLDISKWVETNFRAAPGKRIGLRQMAAFVGGPGNAAPVPPPQGEPRRFRLSGATVRTRLLSPRGDHCASLEITNLDCVLLARLNEIVKVPLAKVIVSSVNRTCAAFPQPMLPWPTISVPLSIDDAPVARGWEYTAAHWIDGTVHHVTIAETSRSIRNVAFLGDSDELVIVVPVTAEELSWDLAGDGLTRELQANVWWRARLDGTRG